jgi:hypothetical protein
VTRVLIIGAGYLGRQVAEALSHAQGISVTVSSTTAQGGGVRLDLRDPSTFGVLREHDLIVNCSDPAVASPRAAALECLTTGRTFLETTAHVPTTEELLRLKIENGDAPGLIVVGVGLFPGVSNLLARVLASRSAPVERLEVGVRLNALSAGGRGMVHQMIDSLFEPSIRYVAGQRVVDRPVSAGPVFPFQSGQSPTLATGFCESILFHHSLNVPNTASYLALRPRAFMPVVQLASFLGTRLGPVVGRAVRGIMRASLLAIRLVLFRGRPTPVELAVIVNRHGTVRPDGLTLEATVGDGVKAAAGAIAATCRCLADTPVRKRGVLTADEAFGPEVWPYLRDVVALPDAAALAGAGGASAGAG